MELREFQEHRNIIETVLPGSIADELGLVPGDELLSINEAPIKDIIDYKFYINDSSILLTIRKKDGEIWEFEIEKSYNEDLGIDFTNPLIDHAKRCSNHCLFCFIDQLPKGMRDTLYFKDDDSRLSFLQGNFITLTNMKEEDIERIIRYHITPINVSIHTTNPDLRKKLLHNKRGGNILSILEKFHKAGLEIQGQIVLIPGYNDREELVRTLEDLLKFYPTLTSLAIVPVGLTKYRKGLAKLRTFTGKECKEVIDTVESFQKRCRKDFGKGLMYLSDEFYCVAGLPVPKEDAYDGYPQIENGVGMVRSFWEEFKRGLKNSGPFSGNKQILMGTGHLAFPLMKIVGSRLEKVYPGLSVEVVEIQNEFFGTSITVSGLLTGRDVVEQLKDKPSDVIMLPKNMMRNFDPITLDDLTQGDLERGLGRPVFFGSWDGYEFLDTIRQVIDLE